MDVHFSDKPALSLLNKTTVDFFKLNKDSRELHVAIQDVESVLLIFFYKDEPKSNSFTNEKVEENEDLEEEKSDVGDSIIVPADNSPQDALEKLFNQRLSLYQFIIDVLQAKKVRPLEIIKEHPQPKPKSVEEDTSYLEII